MKKKSDEDLGTLITREMMSMMLDEDLSYEQRARLFCAIVKDEDVDDALMRSFANSLKTGFKCINNLRISQIKARRARQCEYQRHLRASTEMSVDARTSTRHKVDERALIINTIQDNTSNIPLNPPRGESGLPPAVDADDILDAGSVNVTSELNVAAALADRIEKGEAFAHMRVDGKRLVRCLVKVLKKNSAAEVLGGLEKWTAHWKSNGWAYAPGRITDWLRDGKFLEDLRPSEPEKTGMNYDDVGVKDIA